MALVRRLRLAAATASDGPGDHHAPRIGHLDALARERRQDALAQLTGDGPLLRGLHLPEHLQGQAGLAEGVDPYHRRRLDEPVAPRGILGEPGANLVDDRGRALSVGVVGDRDVEVDPRPDARVVRRHRDLPVRHAVHRAVEVAERRAAQAEVLDGAVDPGDADHVPGAELVLQDDEDAGQPVLDEGLRPEPHGDPDHAEARHRRTDVEPEQAEDHEHRDDRQQGAADADRQALDRRDPALELARGKQLGGVAGATLEKVADADPRGRSEHQVGDERHEHDAAHLERGHGPVRQHEVVHHRDGSNATRGTIGDGGPVPWGSRVPGPDRLGSGTSAARALPPPHETEAMTQSTRRPGFRLPWSDTSDETAPESTSTDATATATDKDAATAAGTVTPVEATSPTGDAPAEETAPAPAPDGETVVAEIDPTAESGAAVAAAEPEPKSTADAGSTVPSTPAGDDDFLASLVTAMRGVVAEERVTSVADLRTAVDDRITQLEARAKERGEELRRKADLDLAGIGDWAKAEIERVNAEAARKVDARRQQLEQQIADHEARSTAEVDGVRGRVTTYEQELEAFFAQLEAIGDPAAFVAAARRMPKPPVLDSEASSAASTDETTPTASLNARLAELGINRGAPDEAATGDAPTSTEPAATAGTSGDETAGSEGAHGRDAQLAERLAALDARPEPTTATAPAASAEGGDEVATAVMVKGLGSFGAITSFKQRLERLEPVRAVTLSLGPTGEFVYRATHPREVDLAGAITALEPGATVDKQADGSLRVTVQPR